jgi:hypothetical protein
MSASAEEEDRSMARRKKHSPEEIVARLRQVEVLTGQGTPVAGYAQVWCTGSGGGLLLGSWRPSPFTGVGIIVAAAVSHHQGC